MALSAIIPVTVIGLATLKVNRLWVALLNGGVALFSTGGQPPRHGAGQPYSNPGLSVFYSGWQIGGSVTCGRETDRAECKGFFGHHVGIYGTCLLLLSEAN